MAAVSSLMKYVEFIQGVYIAAKTMKVRCVDSRSYLVMRATGISRNMLKCVKVVLNPSTKKLLMDHATISSLELVQSVRGDSVRQVRSDRWGRVRSE